ncbi:MAG: hypothetical protein ONB49_11655, partial [candidate division KSB1 bacterium]|nr:hypothetical protein [candidate division KSB1 bacterium]
VHASFIRIRLSEPSCAGIHSSTYQPRKEIRLDNPKPEWYICRQFLEPRKGQHAENGCPSFFKLEFQDSWTPRKPPKSN